MQIHFVNMKSIPNEIRVLTISLNPKTCVNILVINNYAAGRAGGDSVRKKGKKNWRKCERIQVIDIGQHSKQDARGLYRSERPSWRKTKRFRVTSNADAVRANTQTQDWFMSKMVYQMGKVRTTPTRRKSCQKSSRIFIDWLVPPHGKKKYPVKQFSTNVLRLLLLSCLFFCYCCRATNGILKKKNKTNDGNGCWNNNKNISSEKWNSSRIHFLFIQFFFSLLLRLESKTILIWQHSDAHIQPQ